VVLRVTLDVNVWVNHYLALSKGRRGSAAQLLVRACFAGYCRMAPIQPVISHAMLDTLQDVLMRLRHLAAIAEAARNAVEACATDGILGQAPHLVLGGGVLPMMDLEDAGVLDTAISGNADLLITNNMIDFAPGTKSDLDVEVVRSDVNRKVDVVMLRNARLPHGLAIASVFAAKAWLIDGVLPPTGVLDRFRPSPPVAEEPSSAHRP
jgi:predicted nucleic acid-binding protein